jgi:hypothetical protein
MTTYLERVASSHRAQLAATAIVTTVVVAGSILGFQRARRKQVVHDLKASIPEETEKSVQVRTLFESNSDPVVD